MLLAGGSRETLPAESLLALNHTLGNAALTELLALRQTRPAMQPFPLPIGPCDTAPAAWDGGESALTEGPGFGAMAPLSEAAPMAI